MTWAFVVLYSWWAQTGSNRRHLPCKGSALPLSYAPWPLIGMLNGRSAREWTDYRARAPLGTFPGGRTGSAA